MPVARWVAVALAVGGLLQGAALAVEPFEATGIDVAAERDVARACVDLTRPLARAADPRPGDFVVIEPPADAAVSVQGKRLCVDGLRHGGDYVIRLRPGLAAADGGTLQREARFAIRVPDRAPRVAFAGRGTVLPLGADSGVPLRTVNLDRVEIRLLRIAERALVAQLRDATIGTALNGWAIERLLATAAVEIGSATVEVARVDNREVTTRVPVDALVGAQSPGLYVLLAAPPGAAPQPWEARATQWFTITDLGLLTWQGRDGLTVAVRSIATGRPVPGAELRMLSRGNEILARVVAGPDGIVRLAPGLLRGEGADTASLLIASADQAGLAMLQLDQPPLDLSDRGTAGRAPPGALDAFIWTDRGIYRPGETIHAGIMLRDDLAVAAEGVPLSLSIFRPDQIEVERRPLERAVEGTYQTEIELPADAFVGVWTLEARAGDAGGAALGRRELLVQDFVPPRLELTTTAAPSRLLAGQAAQVTFQARYLYGAPGAGLNGEAVIELRRAEQPFAAYPAYRFGLEQEPPLAERRSLGELTTDAEGRLRLPVMVAATGASTPLEAAIRASVFDIDGRAVQHEVVLPLREMPAAVGIRPGFEGSVGEGSAAPFTALLLDGDGNPQPDRALAWELFAEDVDYLWFEQGGRWDWQEVVNDRREGGGELRTGTDGTAPLAPVLPAGRWRLEVSDPLSGVVSSVRFAVGWWAAGAPTERPEKVEVSVRRLADGALEAFIRPPFDARLLVALADTEVRALIPAEATRAGTRLLLPAIPVPVGGMHVVVTALAERGTAHPRLPVRALGLAWIPADDTAQRLHVAIDAADQVRPGERLEVNVAVTGRHGEEPVHVALAAVDDAVLGLTGFSTPDPAAHFLGARALGVELRDLYGRLIDPEGEAGRIDTGGDARLAMQVAGEIVRSSRIVALVPPSRSVGPDGRASFSLEIPDVEGRLRLMAVAWSRSALGSADRPALVRPDLLAELTRPRVLAPGDEAALRLRVTPLRTPPGEYRVALAVDGPLEVEPRAFALTAAASGEAAERELVLRALDRPGIGQLRWTVTAPDGSSVERSLELTVRAPAARQTRQSITSLAPRETLTLDAAAGDGLVAGTATATVTAGPIATLDLAGALRALEAYPYGCVEQTVSRAVPALYTRRLHEQLELGVDTDPNALNAALRRLVNLQGASGEFGGWSAFAAGETWLTAYALDFLLRAGESGSPVPQGPVQRGLNALAARLAAGDDSPAGLQGLAYAAWVLARAGRTDLSTLRYLESRFGQRLPTDLARTQLAAAFQHLGDRERAQRLMASVLARRDEPPGGLADYGSPRRDALAILAIAAEADLQPATALLARAGSIGPLDAGGAQASPQELAWAVRAGASLLGRGEALRLSLNGAAAVTSAPGFVVSAPIGPETRSLRLQNLGDAAVPVAIAVDGVPLEPAAPMAAGYSIKRSLFRLDGSPADPASLRQSEVYVAVIEGDTTTIGDRRTLVVDLLPGGLEPEPLGIGQGTAAPGLGWLGDLTWASHVQPRDDRWLAALDPNVTSFRLAYAVRAVTPGRFVWPGVQVEDMYRPQFRAIGPAMRVQVERR